MKTSNYSDGITDKFDLDRLNALSDGVVAIAITLLVLGIEIPDNHNFDTQGLQIFLIQLEPGVIAYATSFIVIALYWTLHHKIFSLAKHSNNTVIRLNMLFLFAISLIPFVSKLKALYRLEEITVILFSLAHIITGLTVFVTWKYFTKQAHLLKSPIDKKQENYMTLKTMVIPLVSVLSIALAYVNIRLATYLFFIIPVIFLVLNRFHPAAKIQINSSKN